MKMRIVLPAAAAVTITAFAVISFARGAETHRPFATLEARNSAAPNGTVEMRRPRVHMMAMDEARPREPSRR